MSEIEMERTTGIEELASALGISVESIRDVGHRKGLEAACQAVNLNPECDLDVLVVKTIEAYLSASNQVLVPREPTEEMEIAVLKELRVRSNSEQSVYDAMIAAAPKPFKDK